MDEKIGGGLKFQLHNFSFSVAVVEGRTVKIDVVAAADKSRRQMSSLLLLEPDSAR